MTDPAAPIRADAADWLETRLAAPRTGTAHVVLHSVATLTTWPEDRTEHLGRACFHGHWLRCSPENRPAFVSVPNTLRG